MDERRVKMSQSEVSKHVNHDTGCFRFIDVLLLLLYAYACLVVGVERDTNHQS